MESESGTSSLIGTSTFYHESESMALPSTIYRVTIELSDLDRNVFEALQVTAARHPSETEERLVARLLAFALFHEEDLQFTKGVSEGDEPDLWTKGPDGRVVTWIEVGLPEPDRLIKAGRHTEKVMVLACGRGLPVWEQQHLDRLKLVKNLKIIFIDQPFIAALVSHLQRSISWSMTVTEGTLYLQVADETLETTLR